MDFIEPYTDLPKNSLPVKCHVLSDGQQQVLEDYLAERLLDCYISEENLQERVEATELEPQEIAQNKIPDRGSVMSGDFGEIFTLYFLDHLHDDALKLIKKWRYKQDRTKAAPHSDVVLLKVDDLDNPSENDYVICAEAKQKATDTAFDPISRSLEGYESDRTGRLARTLVWLKEKAIDEGNQEDLQLTKRFADEIGVRYSKLYKAVAVVDRAFLNDEIVREIDLPEQSDSFEVIVIGIDNLQAVYHSVFDRACAEAEV